MMSFDTVLGLRKAKAWLRMQKNQTIHFFFITASNSTKSPDTFVKACQDLSEGKVTFENGELFLEECGLPLFLPTDCYP